MDADIKVTDVRDAFRFEQGGTMIPIVRATFYVARYGPFTHEWLKADYSLGALEAHVALTKANLPMNNR